MYFRSANVAAVVFHSQHKHRQRAFFIKIFLSNRRRQDAVQVALAIGGFVTMAFYIPGVDPRLVEVEVHAVVRLGQQHQILRDFLVPVRDLVEHKKCNDALAFRVLRNFEGRVDIHQPRQHPSDVLLRIADQPPVFHDRGRGVRRFPIGFRRGGGSGKDFLGGGTPQNRHFGALAQQV